MRICAMLSLAVILVMLAGQAWAADTAIAPAGASAASSSWPTLHKDNQRSGYTDEVIQGPYERKWYRDFHDEVIATRVEAIVAEGKCFVGTFGGNFYALKVEDGSTAWAVKAGAPIGASGCYQGGKVYFGADNGTVYCINAADGKEVWKYQATAGVWVAPACDGRNVYFGDRAGVFHAVTADTGKVVWTFKTEGMILTPASFSTDLKKIVFGSEDMFVYCLDPAGQQLWKSPKLGGLSLRDHAPTIWQGLVIVRTNPAAGFHQAAGESPAILTAAQKALPMEAEDKVNFDKWGQFVMKLTPRRLKAEQDAVLKFIKDTPAEKTFYAFQLEDGKEPWTAPVVYTAGLHNTPTAPTFNPKTGELYTWMPSALSNYAAGVPGGAITVGKLDRKTGLLEILWHANGDWGAKPFCQPADETQALSLMGGILVNTHQGVLGGMNLQTLKWHPIYHARDTYAGIFGPGAVPGQWDGEKKYMREGYLVNMANEWHGPDRSIAAIAAGRLFWVAGSQVVCLAGPGVAKTATGGTKPPEIIKRKNFPTIAGGNLATGGVGKFDDTVAKFAIKPEQLRKYLDAPKPAKQADTPLAKSMRAKLDATVTEQAGGNWLPFIVELGCSGCERQFTHTAETMQAVALAMPHLSPAAKEAGKKYLDTLFASGAPLKAPVFTSKTGQHRELYLPGPEMLNWASTPPRYQAGVEDLYAVWAYAQHADAWEKVLPQADALKAIFASFAGKPVKFDTNDNSTDAAEHLNAQIAGTLAYARIMGKAGQAAEVDKALARLAELVTERVHHERADTVFVRNTKVAQYNLHQARLPRYLALAPEVGQMLGEFAKSNLEQNVRGITRDLPVWYHAFCERMIGGENYTSTPTLAYGLFLALADGVQAPADELASKLDQPWCRADVYFIEKLSAILRATDGVR